MKPLISVIIPVYNVEKYLDDCIRSVIGQTYDNIEIIVVDDGSTDNSGNMCDCYAEKDERIQVIHKANGGLSDARNAAIEICSGEYITFVDSDDVIAKEYIQLLLNALISTKSNISICRHVSFYDGGLNVKERQLNNAPVTFDKKTALEKMLYQVFDVSAPYKLYQRALFNEIRFPRGKLYEDLATTYKVFLKCDLISYIDVPLYYYRQRQNSIRHNEFSEAELFALQAIDEMRIVLETEYQTLHKAINSRCISMCFQLLLRVPHKSNSAVEQELWNRIKMLRREVILDKHARKKARAAAMLSFLGINTCRLIFILVKKV